MTITLQIGFNYTREFDGETPFLEAVSSSLKQMNNTENPEDFLYYLRIIGTDPDGNNSSSISQCHWNRPIRELAKYGRVLIVSTVRGG